MKRRTLFALCLTVALMCLAAQAFAEYDKTLVVTAMKANGASMGAIKKALDEGDFFTVAEH